MIINMPRKREITKKHKSYLSCIARGKNSGFTLLELTISILMIGIIVLIITGAMRLGSRSVDSGEKKIQSFERIRASFNIIDAQIQSHIPLTYVEDGQKKYYFKGERELIRFSTNYSIWGGEHGYVLATYSVKPDDSGKQILYVSENTIGMEGTRETKLFDNFERISFEYFYRDPTEEQGKWIDQWTDTIRIPEKIKFHFAEGMKNLVFVIPVRVNGLPLSQTQAVETGE